MTDDGELPFSTADLPGTGGILRVQPEDFRVEEIPAYEPTGSGEHLFVYIEKKEMTTAAAIDELARLLSVSPSQIGSAGMKDRRAVTRQWLSLPPKTTEAQLAPLDHPNLRVLSCRAHGNKLRTGHLRGNRFHLVVRELAVPAAEAEALATSILARLADPPFAPNWFGPQRFGFRGQNTETGRALVRGEDLGRKRPRGRQRRLYISAYQSELFNRYLRDRICEQLLGTVVSGDVLAVRASGGVFVTDDPTTDQARFDRGEIAITGPMFGSKMRSPAENTAALLRELLILESENLQPRDFAHLGKLALGTRRPLTIIPGEASATAEGSALHLRFTLPSGSYATALVREIMKGERDFPE